MHLEPKLILTEKLIRKHSFFLLGLDNIKTDCKCVYFLHISSADLRWRHLTPLTLTCSLVLAPKEVKPETHFEYNPTTLFHKHDSLHKGSFEKLKVLVNGWNLPKATEGASVKA